MHHHAQLCISPSASFVINNKVKQRRMEEVESLESIKEEWVCEIGSDKSNIVIINKQIVNISWTIFFEEAQNAGAKALFPTEQKNS
jgi:glycosylphosphatidylinositol transamidase (GPIT) subunit GPI8